MHRCRVSPTAAAAVRSALVLLACVSLATPLRAQTDEHADPDEPEHHFTHPLFAESVSPDTKLRLDYSRLNEPGGGGANEMEMEGEYAFTHFFSIEAGVGFDPDGGQMGETHVLFKVANDALEPAGVHLGYGVELGLPTGTSQEHGDAQAAQDSSAADNIYEITPFLNAGWKSGPWEVIGWSLFQIPTNQNSQDEVGSVLLFNTSVLLHTSDRIDAMVETFGQTGLSGPETSTWAVSIAPGLRVRPVADRPLVLGAGIGLPLTNERASDSHVLVSAFWHF